MAVSLSRDLPAPWTNRDLVLFHGTIDRYESSILTQIHVTLGEPFTDFGRGFYTTTNLWQARAWAWQTSQTNPGSLPRVIQLIVGREAIARLDTLWFVRGASDAEDFWQFVHHCRLRGTHHGRDRKRGWYDVVVGPVASNWRERNVYPDADQISFHTIRSQGLLNASAKMVIS
jgi:hypothetical protein